MNKIGLMTLLVLIPSIGLTKTITFSKTKLTVEVPKACSVDMSTLKGDCKNPFVSVSYQEDSYPVLVQTLKNLEEQPKKYFHKFKVLKTEIITNKISPVGETRALIAVLEDQKGNKLVTIYNLTSLDKQNGVLLVTVYSPKSEKKKLKQILKSLASYQPVQ